MWWTDPRDVVRAAGARCGRRRGETGTGCGRHRGRMVDERSRRRRSAPRQVRHGLDRPQMRPRAMGRCPQRRGFIHRIRPVIHWTRLARTQRGRGMIVARRPIAGGMIEAGAVTLRPFMYRSRIFRPASPPLHSIGVDELTHGGDLPPQFVVGGRLPRDLVAGMEDGGMVATAEFRADAEQ